MEKTTNRNFDIVGFWKRLWILLAPSHQKLKLLVGIIVVEEIARLGGPYLLKLIIDAVTNFDSRNIGKIFLLILGLFLMNQCVSLIAFIADRKIFAILGRVEEYLSNDAHQKMMFLGLSYHEKENTGNKISKVQRGADKIIELLSNLSWEVVPTILQIIFTTIVLFVVDWRFGLIVITFVPLFAYLTLSVNRRVFPMRRKRYGEYEEASGLMAQSIININTVKSFVQEKREVGRYAAVRKGIRLKVLIEFGHILKQNLKRNFVIDLGRVMIMVVGVYFVSVGKISIGTLVFVFTISEKALISLYRVSRLYDRIMDSSEAVERLYEISLEKPEVSNPKKGVIPKKIKGKIEFCDVSFAYADAKTNALDHVSVTIQEGCTTALVGPSGGGKTTLARMVYRHYDPSRGKILLDGKDLREYDLYGFRKFIAIVPQEVEIFNASVAENIAYANPLASREEIVSAAKIANAEEFIGQLKEKYETTVGERGIKLSGGQRQRIGIARAILANPKILIFDEATSNLDSYSEKLIQEAMDKISKNRTVIIIAHRLSTIQKADKIIVLEKGTVVEEGSHVELSQSKGGLYEKLLRLQKMGDID